MGHPVPLVTFPVYKISPSSGRLQSRYPYGDQPGIVVSGQQLQQALMALSTGQTAVDLGPYTINGTGFGVRTAAENWLDKRISQLAVNVVPINNNGSLWQDWSALQSSTGRYPYISSEQTWSRNRSYAFDVRASTGTAGEYKQTLFLDTGAVGYTRMYTNCLIYLTYDNLLTGSYLQWKMMRWYNNADVLDGGNGNNMRGGYLTQQIRPGATASDTLFTGFQNAGTVGSPNVNQWVFYPQTLPKKGAWYRYETWMRQNTTPGTANGFFRLKCTDPTSNTAIADTSISNIIWNGAANDCLFRYLVLQNYFGNATDPAHPGDPPFAQADNGNACAWYGSIYACFAGTDDAFKHVVMTDSNSFATAGYHETQPVSAWGNTDIPITMNQARFPTLAGKYFHMIGGTNEAPIAIVPIT